MAQLKSLKRILKNILNSLVLYLPGVSIVGILAYCVIGLPEAQDIIIYSLESVSGQLFTLLGLIFWSYMVWYSSRVMSSVGSLNIIPIKLEKTKENKMPFEVAIFPRFLGYSCFLVVHLAVMNLPIWEVPSVFKVVYLLSHIILFIVVFKKNYIKEYGGKKILLTFVSIQIVFSNSLFFLTRDFSIDIVGITYRSLLLFLVFSSVFQGLMLVLILDQNKENALFRAQTKKINSVQIDFFSKIRKFHSSLLSKIIGKDADDRDVFRFLILNIIAVIVVLIYLGVLNSPFFSIKVGTFAILLFSLSFLVGLLNLIKTFSRKFKIQFNLLVLVAVLLFSINKDIYEVRYTEARDKNTLAQRQSTMKEFVEGWIKEREGLFEGDSSGLVKIYLILNDGGASRAGYWGASVLGILDDTTKGKFGDRVLAISGASGGTVGNSVYYGLKKNGTTNLEDSVSTFFASDFLSYPAAHLLGYDLYGYYLLNFFGNRFQNRADALERGFEELSPLTQLNGLFSSPVENVFEFEGKQAAFLMTTTSVGDGHPYIISNVTLPNAFQGNFAEALCPDKSINFSTATILGSRFPYFSPAGKIADRYFVDGGYIDNSGAFAMLSFIREFNQSLDGLDSLSQAKARRMRFQIIRLNSGNPAQAGTFVMSGIGNDLFSPLFTLGGMQSSSTKSGLNQLETYLKESNLGTEKPKIEFNFQSYAKGEKSEYIGSYFPMSWSISKWYRAKFDSAFVGLKKSDDLKSILDLDN